MIFEGLHDPESSVPVNTVIRNEIKCIGSFAYSALNFGTALQWLAEGRIGLEGGIIESQLEEGAQWFERLLENQGKVSKVLLHTR